MKTMFSTICLGLITFSAIAQETYTKTYSFSGFSVETGNCATNTSIKVLKGSQNVYYECSGDGAGYSQIDTLALNNDGLPDFVFAYLMEEYTVIGLLVSSSKKPLYKRIDVARILDPYTYDSLLRQAKDETVEAYILRDLNNDGRKGIITNVLKKSGEFHSIRNWTDTIYYDQLTDIARNKRIRGISDIKGRMH